MSRVTLFFCLVMIFTGCETKPSPVQIENGNLESDVKQTEANEQETRREWKTVVKNESYELAELHLSDTESLVYSMILQPDAQLGIGVGIDLAVVADSRGFNYFRYSRTAPDQEQYDSVAHLRRDNHKYSSFLMVEFFKEKPAKEGEFLFDVKMLVSLVQQRKSENERTVNK